MEANELRLGNLLVDYNGPVPNIVSVNLYLLEQFTNHNSIYLPSGIPLTEEWLLKLSFYEYKTCYWVNGLYRVNEMTDGTLYFGYKDDRSNMVELKFVHQLQNLYFALTGEELTLK